MSRRLDIEIVGVPEHKSALTDVFSQKNRYRVRFIPVQSLDQVGPSEDRDVLVLAGMDPELPSFPKLRQDPREIWLKKGEVAAQFHQFVDTSKTPVVAIGYGFRPALRAFDASFGLLPMPVTTVHPLRLEVPEHPFFKGLQDPKVPFKGIWALKQVPEMIQGLAELPTGWAVVQHRTRQFTGLHLHPHVGITDDVFTLVGNVLDHVTKGH